RLYRVGRRKRNRGSGTNGRRDMARPLGTSNLDHGRSATNGTTVERTALVGGLDSAGDLMDAVTDNGEATEATGVMTPEEQQHLLADNAQLRTLCAELEHALQEASHAESPGDLKGQLQEYEQLLEEKSEVIRNLHQQMQQLQAALEEAHSAREPSA